MRISFNFGSGHRYNRYHRGVSVSTTRPLGKTGKMIFGIIFLIIGLLVCWFKFSSDSKLSNYVEVNGRVVDYKMNSDGLYGEIVEYEVNGSKYVVYSNSYSNIPKSIGSVVTVKYNPIAPSQAVLNKSSENILLYGIGGVFVVVGGIVLFLSLKEKKAIDNEEDE